MNMKTENTMWNKILDDNWKPYGQKINHIMESLHKENFNPFKNGRFYYNHNEEEGYETRTFIENFIKKKMKKMFDGNHEKYGLFPSHKQDEIFMLKSKFNYQSRNVYDKSWFLFLKRLGEEFDINYDKIKFSKRPHEYEGKTCNFLGMLDSFSTPMVCYFSLIQLGVNPFQLNKEYLLGSLLRETNPFFQFLEVDKSQPAINALFLNNMLSHSLDFLNIEQHDFLFASGNKNPDKTTNLFSIIKNKPEEERNEIGLILLKHFKDNLNHSISTQHVEHPEENIYHFLQAYCPAAFAFMQKELLSKSIDIHVTKPSLVDRI